MRPPKSRSVCRGHGPHRWHVRTPQGRRRRLGCDSIPPKGSATARDYQWITAIADRNLGGEREAVITIVGATRGDAVEVKVTQDDGTFTVKKPVLSGDLKANVVSNALLAVEYDKAKGGEPVEITFTFDGDNRGLAIKDYTGTIEGEGSGKIELPITGTPSDIGVVKLNMKMTIEGKTIFDDVISASIPVREFHLLDGLRQIRLGRRPDGQ